jgi:hypothetical protein
MSTSTNGQFYYYDPRYWETLDTRFFWFDSKDTWGAGSQYVEHATRRHTLDGRQVGQENIVMQLVLRPENFDYVLYVKDELTGIQLSTDNLDEAKAAAVAIWRMR